MRRDRDGSELEDTDDLERLDVATLRHVLSCSDGWIGEDAEGRPIPCPACRGPRLDRMRRRTRREIFGPWAA